MATSKEIAIAKAVIGPQVKRVTFTFYVSTNVDSERYCEEICDNLSSADDVIWANGWESEDMDIENVHPDYLETIVETADTMEKCDD